MEPTLSKNRIEWIDLCKGIGIILIIAGHCLPLSGKLCRMIFIFHVPLFFFLSGYVAKTEIPFSALVKRKAKTLLLPFACAFALGLAATAIIPAWRAGLTAEGVFTDLLYGNPDHTHNSSTWFLICLFFVTVVFWLCARLPSGFASAAVAVVFACGIAWNKAGAGRLPLDLECVPVALLFYALGYAAEKHAVPSLLQKNRLSCAAALGVSAALLAFAYKVNGAVNLHGLQYGDYFVYVLGGMAGTFFTVAVSYSISFVKPIKSLLLWFGAHSLTIMCTQSLFIRLYALAAPKFGGPALTLYSFPPLHAACSFGIVTLVLCPLCCLCVDGMKSLSKRSKKQV